MRSDRRILGAVAISAAIATASSARGQTVAPPPAERLHEYSPYEKQTIDEVLRERHLTVDAAPEGKLVERVVIVTLPVFEKRDVLPAWLNVFHVTTREHVVDDEVLLRAGDRYRQALVDDTIRNLRRLPGVPQLSAVLVVAATGSGPGRVVVVVITKDVWSLRLSWDVVADPGGLDQLYLQPSETNFLGTHQIAGATFVLEPSAYTVGALYMLPRLGESRIAMQGNADVMINRQSGTAEGTYGSLVAGEPLFSGDTEWAWDSAIAWQDVIDRLYQNAALAYYSDPATHQDCAVAGAGCLPFEWRQRSYMAGYEVTRSFGWAVNHDFTLGAGVNLGVYRIPTPPSGVSPRTIADFTNQYLPVSDTRIGPSLQYHTYEMRFVRVVDFDTLALQEDYRLGHDIVLRVYPSFRALGATRDVFGLYGAAQYTWAVRDGLFRVSLQSTTEPESAPTKQIADASIQPTAHLVTPTVAGIGRIVLDATMLWRWRNYLNVTSTLGGADRLRGYPTNFFIGSSVMSYNVELRSRPVELLSCELAGVAFFDVGDAFKNLSQLIPYQSAGFGFRALFPWLDRTVFQADIGFPVERPLDASTGARIPGYSFIVSFGQAFTTPTVAPQPVLPTGQGPDAP
ncbi:MAG TPA: hypothetical protein VEK07_11675 [Polyangiaceae bacterium]|nr:hypothetical protein [Polyangiaceae bacterium]